jgi:biotin transport system substrate-specific component
MQTNTVQIQKINKWRYFEIIAAAAGSLFLALLSQLSIPLPGTPVPLTLQTLGIFLIGGTLGSRMATVSVILYLLEGTLGLPVFAGWKSNPLWLWSPNAGFLLAFIPAVLLIGKLGRSLLSLSLAQIVISLIGMLWLSFHVGSLKAAFFLGVTPFLLGACIKVLAGSLMLKGYHMIKATRRNS